MTIKGRCQWAEVEDTNDECLVTDVIEVRVSQQGAESTMLGFLCIPHWTAWKDTHIINTDQAI